MCGIAGFFSAHRVDANIANTMLEALQRRGPDGQGRTLWDEVFSPYHSKQDKLHNALLHTRLAIRDLSPQAAQPMSNTNQDIWICYNGEVYGWEDDAAQLKKEGIHFSTHSDTEFILHAYQKWGFEGLIPRLRGMFALVIVDLRLCKVFLIRDRLGLKPLVYHFANGSLAFGSTVRSVIPFLPREQRQFSAEAIDAYLAHRYIPAPRTVFKHIQRLENGHYLCFDLATRVLSKHSYWHPKAAHDDWKAVLDTAIKLRTASDRPVGIFLSSGVDSNLVAARLAAQGYTNISTYSAAFPGSALDESQDAAQFAADLGMQNLRIPIEFNVSNDFERLVADLDEPFADPSSIPTWYLARETVKHVTVALGGDGGDELFAGYKRYKQHLRSKFRRHMRLPLPLLKSWRAKGYKNLAEEARIGWQDAYALRFSGFTPVQRRFLQPDLRNTPTHYWRPANLADTKVTPLHTLLACDYANFLPEYVLRKADLCSMAHGLEVRAPLLDHNFVQSVMGMNDAERFTKPAKAILQKAAPEVALALARKKMGFNPPLKNWLHNDLALLHLGLGNRLKTLTHGQIDAHAVDHLLAAYLHGEEALAEQILQLLLLAESLRQLQALP